MTTSQPHVVMIAGPNGAGKTSTAMKLLPDYLHFDEFVNADEIAYGLSPLNPTSTALEAGRLMLKRIHSLIAKRKNFAFETTGAGHVHLRTLAACKQAGYKTGLIFLALHSPELAIERVRLRVAQGGHDVPEKDIIRRFHAGLIRLTEDYISLAENMEIYDNSSGTPNLIATRSGTNTWQVLNNVTWQIITGGKYD